MCYFQDVDAKAVMTAMKQYVYNHCPAVAAVGPLMLWLILYMIINLFVVGPIEQLREYNRTRSRMYTIIH